MKRSQEPLLQIKDLAVSFCTHAGIVPAVRGVSFDVAAGETVALVGESGSGKSVTAHSILQLLPYPPALHPNGSIRFRGQELLGATEYQLRQVRGDKISMVFQEPMTSLNPLHPIERQINETLFLHKGMSPRQAHARTLELLDLVGLPDAGHRLQAYPHQLSGGQRQRVMIAMALANEPALLIADEPTTALDVTVQAQILRLLKQLQARLHMALLLITHDLTMVRHMADRVCVMQAGEIVEQGPIEEIFERPRAAYTRALLAAEPSGRPVAAGSDAPELLVAKELRVWFPIKTGLFGKPRDYLKAVNGISLRVRCGHTVGIVGESGSGKTTLGLALLRLERSQGTLHFAGRAIHRLRPRALRPLRKEMQIVFQDPFGSLSPRLSVQQIVEEGLKVHRLAASAAQRETLIVRALQEVGLDPAARHRYPHEFSGGQRQRIAIARALVLKPRLMILDEPTSALDRTVQAQIIDLLRDLQARHGLTYLFISHDLKVIQAICDEVIVMRAGRIVEAGKAAQIFAQPRESYTQTLLNAAFDLPSVLHTDIAAPLCH